MLLKLKPIYVTFPLLTNSKLTFIYANSTTLLFDASISLNSFNKVLLLTYYLDTIHTNIHAVFSTGYLPFECIFRCLLGLLLVVVVVVVVFSRKSFPLSLSLSQLPL